MKVLFISLLAYLSISASFIQNPPVKIFWADKVEGDFRFAKRKSIECDAWCYEWAGTDKIFATKKSNDTILCYTEMNEATHCCLNLKITGDICIANIILNSIVKDGSRIFDCEDGSISIDKALLKKNILKASFDFKFKNPENPKSIYWKGKIYTKIY